MMKTLFIAVIIAFAALPARAGTPVNAETANAYFDNCMKKDVPRLTPASHEALCSCTAAELSKKMTIEDIKAMGTATPEGQTQRRRLLTEVYAPCMNYPVNDLVSAQCNSDPAIAAANIKGNRVVLCECVAKGTGAWFSTTGQKMLVAYIAKYPTTTDPIGPIMDSPAFKKASYQTLTRCLTTP